MWRLICCLLNSPIPLILLHEFVFIEKLGFVSAVLASLGKWDGNPLQNWNGTYFGMALYRVNQLGAVRASVDRRDSYQILRKLSAVQLLVQSIRCEISVAHIMVHHMLTRSGSPRLIYPIWLDPMFSWNNPEFGLGWDNLSCVSETRLASHIPQEHFICTYFTKLSVNGSSFKNTYGYWYSRLKRSSICFRDRRRSYNSLFLARMTNVAFAFRVFTGRST